MKRRIAILAGIGGVLAIAAAGSLAAPKPDPNCTSEGTALTISAIDSQFNKECLVAPPDQAFTIAFDNQENVPHNVSIYDRQNGNATLFKGEVFRGPKTVTYQVPALPAGTYEFVCDPHKEIMVGRFIAGDPPPPTTTTEPPATTTTTGGPLPKLPPG